MKIKMKLFASLGVVTILIAGCGGGDTRGIQNSSQSTLNDNYLEVAKSIYNNPRKFSRSLRPEAQKDPSKLYINKVVKPREYKVTEVQAQQGNDTIAVSIDKDYKYATITLNGVTKKMVNFKDFTLSTK